jgi:hypothetical protein
MAEKEGLTVGQIAAAIKELAPHFQTRIEQAGWTEKRYQDEIGNSVGKFGMEVWPVFYAICLELEKNEKPAHVAHQAGAQVRR